MSSFTQRASDKTITHSGHHRYPRTGEPRCTFIVLVVAAHRLGHSKRVYQRRCRHAAAVCSFLSSPSPSGGGAELFILSSSSFIPVGKRHHQRIRHRLRRRTGDKQRIQRVQLHCRCRPQIGRGNALIVVIVADITAVAHDSGFVFSARQKDQDCSLFNIIALITIREGDGEAVNFGFGSVPMGPCPMISVSIGTAAQLIIC